jgi:Fe-S-cluster-containing hydrogenase component 2
VKESTKGVFRKHGWRVDRAVHNYLYFIFYKPYVHAALLATRFVTKYFSWIKPISPFVDFVFQRYHSKVLSVEDTKKIFSLNEDLRLISDETKKIVPFKYATKMIFQEPEFIAVMDCPCKKSAGAPEETINSCIAVGRGLATFWLDHCKKYNSRKINQGEALDIISDLRKKGYVTQAFFKVATGGSTGVICNCHPDYCVNLIANKLSKKISPKLKMSEASGYSIAIDEKKCDLSGDCLKNCPSGAISIRDNKLVYDREKCFGCELCVESCSKGALKLYVDREKTMPLDIDKVKELAAMSDLKN